MIKCWGPEAFLLYWFSEPGHVTMATHGCLTGLMIKTCSAQIHLKKPLSKNTYTQIPVDVSLQGPVIDIMHSQAHLLGIKPSWLNA